MMHVDLELRTWCIVMALNCSKFDNNPVRLYHLIKGSLKQLRAITVENKC
jgi:hypothetical protein